MPWSVKKGGGDCGSTKWAVVNDDTGATMGCHDTKQGALDQQAALYANVDVSASRRSVELVTIPNVEVLEVGTWETSTGTWTWTTADLEAACAAFDDPGYWVPVIKIGHDDPRFDGQPAIGRMINPRLSADKMTLIVDYQGVPRWLAEIMPSAFPGRSIEGEFGLVTATGTKHRFALTSVALLGTTDPAIATLEDIAALFGVGEEESNVAAGQKVLLSFGPDGTQDVSKRRRSVRASVNIDDVRAAFYESIRDSANPWAWIREIWSDFLIADNDEGELYKIPWSEGTDGSIEFGEPAEVQVQYVPAPADAEDQQEQEGLVLLSRKPTRVRAASTGENEMELDELRKRLGLADDADEATVLAALDERLEDQEGDEELEEEEESEEESEEEDETSSIAPPGTTLIGSEELGELRVAAAAGAEARELLRTQDRNRFVESVRAKGKLKKSNTALQSTLEKEFDRDPKAAAAMAEELAVVIPTSELGHGGEGATGDDALYDMLFPTAGKA